MKHLKKFLFLLLLCLITTSVPLTAQAADYVSGNWEYSVSSGEATITGYRGSSSIISIPSSVGGYPVTAIRSRAFTDSTLTTLTIPKSIESIGSYAFSGCKYLKTINFNAKKASVTWNAFEDAGKFSNSLTVTFGSSVKKIPDHLFDPYESHYAHVTSITIPNSVEAIGNSSFAGCFDLTEVTWGNGIQQIDSYAFKNCTKLKSITIPSKTESIGSYAFAGCKYLKTINFNAKKASVTWNAFEDAGKFSNSLTVTFGSSVKKIPDHLFDPYEDHYAHVTSITIPNSVETIGASAFNNCLSLKTVTIQSRNTYFPGYGTYNDAFVNCSPKLTFKCLRGSTAASYASKAKYKISYLNPKGTSISTLTPVSKGFKVTYKKQASGTTGYQIQYATNSKFSSATTKTIKGTSKVSATYKNLKGKKKYYVRVRTYKTTSGKTTYSSWSKSKTVTTKK